MFVPPKKKRNFITHRLRKLEMTFRQIKLWFTVTICFEFLRWLLPFEQIFQTEMIQ